VEPDQKCVIDLKHWYASHDMAQKDLAAAVGMTPQGLADLFSNRNQPTGAQAVAILKFLQSQNMSVITERRTPKTLAEAKEQLEALEQASAAMQARLDAHIAAGHVPKTSSAPITLPTTSAPATGIQAPTRPPRVNEPTVMASQPQKIRLSATLDTPASIETALASMNDEALRSALFGTCKNDVERLQQRLILAELKRRREI
jgi:hypothetical protein